MWLQCLAWFLNLSISFGLTNIFSRCITKPSILDMHIGRLARQATLPADDPSWHKPQPLPGQPAPIPPRNEPILYIPTTVNSVPPLKALLLSYTTQNSLDLASNHKEGGHRDDTKMMAKLGQRLEETTAWKVGKLKHIFP